MFGCLGPSCAPIPAEHAQVEVKRAASTVQIPPAAKVASKELGPDLEICGHDGFLRFCQDDE